MSSEDSSADLRRMSAAELERLGRQSLRDHIQAQAVVAHQKYAPLTPEKLTALLQDPECVRYPVRLVFEFGEMASHQFAQPGLDPGNLEQDGWLLYLRPSLKDRPDLLPLAVSYMLPVINYGEVVSDSECLLYGATLLGLIESEYYRQICQLADLCGAEPR